MDWQTNKNILIQGIHMPLAQYYVPQMVDYGTAVIGGVSAGRGGETIDDLPVFDLVLEAVAAVGDISTSIIFVESFEVLDAALEAIAAGIARLIIVSAGVPPLDMVRLLRHAQSHNVSILGPGSNGLIIPDRFWLGTGFTGHFQAGEVGIVTRFSSLSREAALLVNQGGLGQSVVVDLGNADLSGSTFEQWLTHLDADPQTKVILLLGRYGSQEEINLIPFIAERIKTPVVTYLCGRHAPIHRSCYDATSTIIANHLAYCFNETYTPQEMAKAFQNAKLLFAKSFQDIVPLLKKAIAPPTRSRRTTRRTKSSTDSV